MAFSVNTPLGDGVTKQFAINFTNGIFSRESIHVAVEDELDGGGNQIERTFTFINDGLIELDGDAPADGKVVTIRRIMDKTQPAVDFADGEILDEENLDLSMDHLLDTMHEVLDGYGLTEVHTDINMNGHRITNLPQPLDASEPLRLGDVGLFDDDGTQVVVTVDEEITLIDGQTTVTLTEFSTAGTAYHIYGDNVDRGELQVNIDYVVTSTQTIELQSTFPDGTVISAKRNEKHADLILSSDKVTYKAPVTGSVESDVETRLSVRLSVKDFGAVGDGVTDDTAALETAALFASVTGQILEIPTGTYNCSTELDWSAYTLLQIIGGGRQSAILNFTNDTNGLTFGGRLLTGIKVVGVGGAATGTGARYVSTQRKFVESVWVEDFNDGHSFDEGNLSYLNAIFAVGNNNHGFVASLASIDSNAITVGAMDLRGNGADGFHMTTGVPLNVAQQWLGGLITCQSNGGNAANISGRGHSLTFYDEVNGGDIKLDSNSAGCEITALFGSVTDSGSNNNVKQHRVGSVEAVVNSNLQYSKGEFNNRDFVGRIVQTVTADRTFQYQMLGSGSDGTLILNHSSGGFLNLLVEGNVDTTRNHTGGGLVTDAFTDTELNDISSAVNTVNKVQWKQVFNSTQGRPIWAVQSGAGANWNYSDGTLANDPV